MAEYINQLNAVGATTTSDPITLDNSESAVITFTAASISAGNGVFQVDASNDGVNWVLQVPIIDMNVTNTNAQNLTRVATVTLSSNTSKIYALDPHFMPKMIRIKVTFTTDGAYSASVKTNKLVSK